MPPDAFLLISLSGRGLARAAARAGRPAVGVDAFADRDTRDLARNWEKAPLEGAWEFDEDALLAIAGRLCPPGRCAGLVHGSGFESRPGLLERLARGRRLFGNPAAVLERVHDPARFFAVLRRLGLPHPETRLEAPAYPAGWLVKRAGGSGGTHIREAAVDASGRHDYFQRRAPGMPHSLLFLANGREVAAVGFNRMLPAPAAAPSPWAYAGAVAPAGLPESVAREVVEAARALAAEYGLAGLNGIDFLWDGRDWRLLELNPRPTATLELWDRDPMPALFDLHLQARGADLPALSPPPGGRAVAVAYAEAPLRVPAGFPWPDWCADLPDAGASFQPGEPVCSTLAWAEDAAAAETLALARRATILERLARSAAARPGPSLRHA